MRIVSTIVLVFFFIMAVTSDVSAQNFTSVAPIPLKPALTPFQGIHPPTLSGFSVHPTDPFVIDFFVDHGDTIISESDLKMESIKMIKYFLAALAIPDDQLWVNLSPYEPDRIMPKVLARTQMGQTLLNQDYLLKDLTAALLSPEHETGRVFWEKIYASVESSQQTLPIDLFNKVWIVPDNARVAVHGQNVFLSGYDLKVMLEEDYLSLDHQRAIASSDRGLNVNMDEQHRELMRQHILPVLEHEINHGRHFAPLRQIMNVMVLGKWYKGHLKDSWLGQMMVEQNKLQFQIRADEHQKIYQDYLKLFSSDSTVVIKEDYDPVTQQMTQRRFVSGGIQMVNHVATNSWQQAQTAQTSPSQDEKIDFSRIRAKLIKIMNKNQDLLTVNGEGRQYLDGQRFVSISLLLLIAARLLILSAFAYFTLPIWMPQTVSGVLIFGMTELLSALLRSTQSDQDRRETMLFNRLIPDRIKTFIISIRSKVGDSFWSPIRDNVMSLSQRFILSFDWIIQRLIKVKLNEFLKSVRFSNDSNLERVFSKHFSKLLQAGDKKVYLWLIGQELSALEALQDYIPNTTINRIFFLRLVTFVNKKKTFFKNKSQQEKLNQYLDTWSAKLEEFENSIRKNPTKRIDLDNQNLTDLQSIIGQIMTVLLEEDSQSKMQKLKQLLIYIDKNKSTRIIVAGLSLSITGSIVFFSIFAWSYMPDFFDYFGPGMDVSDWTSQLYDSEVLEDRNFQIQESSHNVGGIDLNPKHYTIAVDPAGSVMRFPVPLANDLSNDAFDFLVPEIQSIRPMNIPLLFGQLSPKSLSISDS